jgi:hypothetical protein
MRHGDLCAAGEFTVTYLDLRLRRAPGCDPIEQARKVANVSKLRFRIAMSLDG